MSALSELLQQSNPEGLSVAAIAEKARAKGHEIGHDTVWKYMSGRHGRVADPYLRALSDVLPVRFEELRRAAKLPANLGDYVPPPEASALDRKERAALDVLIRSIAQGKVAAASGDTAGTVHQFPELPAPADVPHAARRTAKKKPGRDNTLGQGT